MKINYELNLRKFEAWSGAIRTLNRIQNENMCDELENILEDIYPDGMSETGLNDLLWFEPDFIYELLGLKTESEIEEEIEELENEIEELIEDLEEDENEEIIYKIEELKEEIEGLKEELKNI